MAGWTEIESTTLASAAASVSFTTGLSGYKFFRLTIYIVNDANSKQVYLRFNNDSGSNYTWQRITGSSTSVTGNRATGEAQIAIQQTMAASQSNSYQCLISKPAAGVKAQVTVQAGQDTSPVLILVGGEWDNTADLISRIDVLASSNNFAAGTSLLLEGLAA